MRWPFSRRRSGLGGETRPQGSLGLRVIRANPSLKTRLSDTLWRLKVWLQLR
jgi:hypothetical protein